MKDEEECDDLARILTATQDLSNPLLPREKRLALALEFAISALNDAPSFRTHVERAGRPLTALDEAGRHISPQVAAALLSTTRAELTPQQVEIVDTLKEHCPGFAVMRKLVLGFRTILRVGRLATLNRWMARASKTGIHALERFVRTLQQDRGAVEAAVTEPWSNGPVEGHINRLKMLKR